MIISNQRVIRGLAFAGFGLAIGFLGAGCGKAPEAGTDTKTSEAVQAIPPPDLDIPTKKPEKVPPFLYVKKAFQSESDYGTHDFPVGAKVAVLEKQGDSYLVELNGVAVLNGAEFFSETLVVDEPVASPSPVAEATPAAPSTQAAATPATQPANDEDYITAPAPGDTIASVPEPTPAASPAASPVAAAPSPVAEPAPPEPGPVADSAEDRRVSELSEKIRDINEKIDRSSSPGSPAPEPEVQKLRKQRDQLSEELTTLTKP